MRRFLLGLACLTASITAYGGEMPEPYASIREVPFDGHGWFYFYAPFRMMIRQRKPKVIVELGSWLGKSTRYFAAEAKQWGGKVYAVDHWRGSPGEEQHDKDPRLSELYHIFLSNVRHAGLENVIVPIRMGTLEAAEALDVMADMVFVDAGHTYQAAYDDIRAWLPHLNRGGLMCGDDWTWPSVRSAVEQVAKEEGFTVKVHRNLWWYE